MVSLMTALWFAFLEAPDRVSVKPHASPVLHAINHLLGRLDRRYLTMLRQYGGLQSYPSRTKDPDPVDYSTGSVGLGATAPIWGALAHRYVAGHFDVPVGPPPRRWGARPPPAPGPPPSTCGGAGARSRGAATPSGRGAPAGRRSPPRWGPGSGR